MKKEEIYNEAIGGDEGFAPGEGYPSCDGQPCANVSGDDGVEHKGQRNPKRENAGV